MANAVFMVNNRASLKGKNCKNVILPASAINAALSAVCIDGCVIVVQTLTNINVATRKNVDFVLQFAFLFACLVCWREAEEKRKNEEEAIAPLAAIRC